MRRTISYHRPALDQVRHSAHVDPTCGFTEQVRSVVLSLLARP